MADKSTELDQPLGGLVLMIILTSIWVLLAEYYFGNFDFRIIDCVFGAILVYFIYSYWKFFKKKTFLPVTEKIEDPKKERLYWIIFALEGVAILVTNIILTNIKRDELFISCFALIVGLHFIPLAKVFERKFDYYIGWTYWKWGFWW